MSYKDVILERIAGDGSAKRRLNWARKSRLPCKSEASFFY